jgi:hydrogenase maturation protein HypF
MTQPPALARRAVHVRGVVQGVGYRPFVYRLASSLGLVGWVRNGADGVSLEVQGPAHRVRSFVRRLRRERPAGAVVAAVATRRLRPSAAARTFEIRASLARGPVQPTIPADLVACPACRAEIATPGGRRYGYPFTSCSHCGPRYSIIRALPYDRPGTTMADFRMCRACESEYTDPGDRRFHAEPIACPHCGPELRLLAPDGRTLATGGAALARAAAAVRGGRILALKGVGGFQLLVDATATRAVARLRARKRRPAKPFAVMLPSLGEARRLCRVSAAEARVLSGAAGPIVLLSRRLTRAAGATRGAAPGGRRRGIAAAVAPGNPRLGVMLPSSPLHGLLAEAIGRPIVCTSGNPSAEPMAIETAEALARLGDVADVFLTHDRPIVRPVDDSVVQLHGASAIVLRRARGYAPRAVPLEETGPTVLALGAHQKNTVALAIGRECVLSTHHGDLGSPAAVAAFEKSIEDLGRFFETRPEIVACDLHPDYASTRAAERLAGRWRVPLVRVQHHHAHLAACLAEHGVRAPVLGFAWDGSGHGEDGTVWGGEALSGGACGFRRVGHLRPFPLVGGERAVREPRRAALGLLWTLAGADAASALRHLFEARELDVLLGMLEGRVHAPLTSSVGRLFDAIAALVGLHPRTTFEGEAAMALEFAARGAGTDEAYPIALSPGDPLVADWAPLVESVLADARRGVPRARIGARFHNALAELAVAVARRVGIATVVLSGGCFQNRLLLDRARRLLRTAGFEVRTPHRVPPNDGGIALGQAVIARAR